MDHMACRGTQEAPRPTRAEATDIANSVLDGADAFILGAQTMRGHHPADTIRTVVGICREAEAQFDFEANYDRVTAALSEVRALHAVAVWFARSVAVLLRRRDSRRFGLVGAHRVVRTECKQMRCMQEVPVTGGGQSPGHAAAWATQQVPTSRSTFFAPVASAGMLSDAPSSTDLTAHTNGTTALADTSAHGATVERGPPVATGAITAVPLHPGTSAAPVPLHHLPLHPATQSDVHFALGVSLTRDGPGSHAALRRISSQNAASGMRGAPRRVTTASADGGHPGTQQSSEYDRGQRWHEGDEDVEDGHSGRAAHALLFPTGLDRTVQVRVRHAGGLRRRSVWAVRRRCVCRRCACVPRSCPVFASHAVLATMPLRMLRSRAALVSRARVFLIHSACSPEQPLPRHAAPCSVGETAGIRAGERHVQRGLGAADEPPQHSV
jgi:Pyruvate kinase, barrel domain